VRVGGGQGEDHVCWRLLQRAQERLRARSAQPVSLVDDVQLVGGAHRQEGRLGCDVANVILAAVAGRVQLDDVGVRGPWPGDLQARLAGPARVAVAGALRAEQRGREQAGHGGLAEA